MLTQILELIDVYGSRGFLPHGFPPEGSPHMKRIVLWSVFAVVSACSNPTPRALGNLDVLAAAPSISVTDVQQRVDAHPEWVRPGSPVQMDDRLGVPTFVWASRDLPTPTLLPGDRTVAYQTAALDHFARLAPLYRLGANDLKTITPVHTHDLGRGAVVVQLEQRVDDLEVFREQARLVLGRDGRLVSIAGQLSPTSDAMFTQGRRFSTTPSEALAAGFSDLSGNQVTASSFVSIGAAEGGFERFAPADALRARADAPSQAARAKKVWFRLQDALVPAYYLEVDSVTSHGTDWFSYVISAVDGKVLFRNDLTADQQSNAFQFRVWAAPANDPANPAAPADGPQGNLFDPHPTGTLDGTNITGAVPQTDVTLASSPYVADPWMPLGAVESTGNNVDAYVDLVLPDGFTPNSIDFRAPVTAPGKFLRTYDPALPNAVNQQQAAITQMFYNLNFFHDWYYPSGFTEAAGNAQANNYGRGGLQNDSIRAEGQDSSGRNNANMSTPADGAQPKMQMYLFDGIPTRHLFFTGALTTDDATGVGSGWGAPSHDVTAQVVWLDDGVGSTTYPPAATNVATIHDGCDAPTATTWQGVAGKIVFIDRGGAPPVATATCGFVDKAINAQAAGAAGVIIASTTPHAATSAITMGGTPTTPITIPVYQLSTPDGDAVRAAFAAGTVNARMQRLAAIDRDGTVDNQIMAHEWGHYISNRLVGNANGLTSSMSRGLGEGWADFHALLLTVKQEDTAVSYNASYNGVYGLATWVSSGGTNGPLANQGVYFGIRRMPYSTDLTKNSTKLGNIQDNSPVPTGAPFAFWPAPNTTAANNGNSEVHNTGEIWANMLWECYASLLRDTVGPSPRLTFTQARNRMKDYLVAAYKATPGQPTLLEARDAVLAVAYANDPVDYHLFLAAFAKRGAGVGAIVPDRYSATNNGVTESNSVGVDLVVSNAVLNDSVTRCDTDGVLDTGETGNLVITLRNDGINQLTATTATVTAVGPNAGLVSFPAGTTLTFGATNPRETTTASVQVAMQAGVTGLKALDFQLTYGDPSSAPASNTVVLTRRANYDDVLGQSTTDDVESSAPQFTSFPLGNLPSTSAWVRQTISQTDHNYAVVDQNGTTDLALVSPSLAVTPGGTFSLTFRHRFSFEFSGTSFFDGAVVEISTDGGATWSDIGNLATGQTYGATALSAGTPLGGRRAFVGVSPGYPAYVTSTIPLGSTYAGQVVRVRFRLGTDSNGRANGWEVDDIAFTGIANLPFPALLPNRCTANQTNRRPTVTIGAVAAPVPERTSVALTSTAADLDNDPLTYQWSQIAGPPVTFTTPTSATTSVTAPDVPATGGSVVVSLIVSDGTAFSALATRTITITNVDRAPTASAGTTIAAAEGTLVQLAGTAADPDGDALTIAWTQTAGPTVALSSTTALNPTFVAPQVPVAGSSLTFVLTATANGQSATSTVQVDVSNVNASPTVDAGPAQTVPERSLVQLHGSGLDPDGTAVTYEWTQVSPAAPVIALSDTHATAPTFTAPEVTQATDFVFSLAVSDGIAPTVTGTVTITVNDVNRAPVVVITAPATALEQSMVTLDASGTTDPDGNTLTYTWTQTAPETPKATLNDVHAAAPTFKAPDVSADTAFTFSLVVNDGTGDSPAQTVTVTVKDSSRGPTAVVGRDQTVVGGDTVTLDGRSSLEPDGAALTFAWKQVDGATVTLDDTSSATPTFTAPTQATATLLKFELTVSTSKGSSKATQYVLVNPKPSGCGCGSDPSATSVLALVAVALLRRKLRF